MDSSILSIIKNFKNQGDVLYSGKRNIIKIFKYDNVPKVLYKCTFGGCDRKFKSAFERNRHEKNVHSSSMGLEQLSRELQPG